MIFPKFLMHRWQNIRLRQKESASITIQSHFKERANAPQTSTLSMGIEKAGAYESSLGSIFGRCVKAFWGSVGENERQLKQIFLRIKNYSLQWGAAESVQDKIQLTAKNSRTKNEVCQLRLKNCIWTVWWRLVVVATKDMPLAVLVTTFSLSSLPIQDKWLLLQSSSWTF